MRALAIDDVWIGAGAVLAGALLCAIRSQHHPLWKAFWEWTIRDWWGRVSSLRISGSDLAWVFRAARWMTALCQRLSRVDEPPTAPNHKTNSNTFPFPNKPGDSLLVRWLRELFTLCLWVSRQSHPSATSGRVRQPTLHPPARLVYVAAIVGVAVFSVSAVVASLHFRPWHSWI